VSQNAKKEKDLLTEFVCSVLKIVSNAQRMFVMMDTALLDIQRMMKDFVNLSVKAFLFSVMNALMEFAHSVKLGSSCMKILIVIPNVKMIAQMHALSMTMIALEIVKIIVNNYAKLHVYLNVKMELMLMGMIVYLVTAISVKNMEMMLEIALNVTITLILKMVNLEFLTIKLVLPNHVKKTVLNAI